MISLVVFDLVLLGIFLIFVASFLYRNRDKLQKQGLLFLYRTHWGIKKINRVGRKYPKTLNFLSYVSITIGYFLMAGALYLVGRIVYVYLAFPSVVRDLKVPPITPLFPYIDKVIPNLGLPKFYFVYFIVILAIIAITHEFAHGIFAALRNVKIKKTGFGFFPTFLPVFPLAFVELDEAQMAKKKKFTQMAVLSAGTFTNFLTAILSLGILFLMFTSGFTASGVTFDSYAYGTFEVSAISQVNGIPVSNATFEEILSLMSVGTLSKVETLDGKSYVADKEFLEQVGDLGGQIGMYYDAPAINYGIPVGSIITKIEGQKISGLENLQEELYKYSPGEEIMIETKYEGEFDSYEIVLGENPENAESPYLGIGFRQIDAPIIEDHKTIVPVIGERGTYYESKDSSGILLFFYTLVEWLVLISFSIALINMLPVGIFDGGRFFYLTVLGITKNKKVAEKAFAFMTYLFLLLLFGLMVLWVRSFF